MKEPMKKLLVATAFGAALAASTAFAQSAQPAMVARTTGTPSSQYGQMANPNDFSALPMGSGTEIQGTIRSVDPGGNTVTLEDGTILTIPSSVSVMPGPLLPGATITATYQNTGTANVVTWLDPQWSPKS